MAEPKIIQGSNPVAIPSIETIVEDAVAGKISTGEAITWLYQHSQDAHQTLTDYFAGLSIGSLVAQGKTAEQVALESYGIASEMMKVRTE